MLWQQGVFEDTCKGPGGKCGVWNLKITTGVEKGGRLGASGNGGTIPLTLVALLSIGPLVRQGITMVRSPFVPSTLSPSPYVQPGARSVAWGHTPCPEALTAWRDEAWGLETMKPQLLALWPSQPALSLLQTSPVHCLLSILPNSPILAHVPSTPRSH